MLNFIHVPIKSHSCKSFYNWAGNYRSTLLKSNLVGKVYDFKLTEIFLHMYEKNFHHMCLEIYVNF